MSLKPFAVMTGSVALPTVQVCCESGSTFSVHCIAVNTSLLLTTLKEGVGNVFAWVRTCASHQTKTFIACHRSADDD